MNLRVFIVVAATATLGVVAGCGIIGGIETISLVEANPDAGAGDAGADAPSSCKLPTKGDAFLRLGNLVPAHDAYDFCVKPTSSPSFDDIVPVFASGGSGCPAGLHYKDVTIAFRLQRDTYDIRMVPAGSQDCASASAEVAGVEAEGNRIKSVLAFSESENGQMLRALPESQPASNRMQMRFVHALLGHETLDCGVTDHLRLPATLLSSVFRDVPYGDTAPAGDSDIGTVDEHGYLLFSYHGGVGRFGIARPQETDALVTLATRFSLNSSHTLFAIGRQGDPAFPPALWTCDEGSTTDGVLAVCGSPVDLSVEVFSPQLTDLFTPLFRERVEPVISALNNASADILCINEVRSPKLLDKIIEAVKENYPHSVIANQLTPSDSDMTDQAGIEPPPFTTPACTAEAANALADLMDCVDAKCTQDDGTGHYFSEGGDLATQCVASACYEQLPPLLLTGGDAGKACWMCALTQMAGEESTEWIREACTTDPDTRFAYRGSLGLAVLSKEPMGAAQSWHLPSTGWQHGLLRVPIELASGVPLDVYCSDLTQPVSGIVFPYVGNYGGSAQGDARWVAEQTLQAQRVVHIMQEHTGSSGTRGVLATMAYAGPEHYEDDVLVLSARSPDVYAVFAEAFAPLVPTDYVPDCTECVDNPVLSGLDPADLPAADAWTSHLLGLGISSGAVRDTHVTFTEAVYEVAAPEGSRMIPPSSQYGLRSLLRITQ